MAPISGNAGMFLVILALCGCEPPGKYEAVKAWERLDGQPVDGPRLYADGKQCMAAADLVARGAAQPGPVINNTAVAVVSPGPPGGINFISRNPVSIPPPGPGPDARVFQMQMDACMAQRGYIYR
jgi:hypothetical protein